MKKLLLKVLVLNLVAVLGLGASINTVYAEEIVSGISVGIEPTSKTLSINSNSVYDNTFKATNGTDEEVQIEVFTAPYSYVYSDTEDLYKLGYTNENNYTQLTRWIKIKDSEGNYVEKPTFTVGPNESIDIEYRITTPDNIPAGGQYAVIFVHTLSGVTTAEGIRAEPNIGMIVYGHSLEGEAKIASEISDLQIKNSVTENGVTRNNFYASAKVKNTGNIDFNAYGTLKVEPVVGFGSYETEKTALLSVIPDAELIISDEWVDSPSFGIYKATWTVTVGDNTEVLEKILFLVPFWVIVLTITLLTILIIWIIIRVRKRKERRSRLAV